jgi:hypothetical protein
MKTVEAGVVENAAVAAAFENVATPVRMMLPAVMLVGKIDAIIAVVEPCVRVIPGRSVPVKAV